ncbi:MAG: YCF48-related protein [Ignavibacteria bacterium]
MILRVEIFFFVAFAFTRLSYSQSGWIQQNSGVNTKLNSVKFINSQTGVCVGNSGKILRTTNGGISWVQQPIEYQNNLYSLSITPANICFAVGDSGLTLKSTDEGATWGQLNMISSSMNFTSVFFVNDSIGFLGGINNSFTLQNKIYKTVNGGFTWDSLQTVDGETYTKFIFFINPNTGWSINGYDVLATEELDKTTNGGINWTHQFSTNRTVDAVYFIDSLNGWMSAYSGFSVPSIFRSTNGGNNWLTIFPSGTGTVIYSLYFINKSKGWAAGEYRTIQATTNGGIDWIDQTNPQAGVHYRSIYFTDSLTGYVVGDSGTILKTTTGGILTNFSNTSSEIPDKYFLSQNYPNPFNPNTIINYATPLIPPLKKKGGMGGSCD